MRVSRAHNGALRFLVQLGAVAGIACGGIGDDMVDEKVGACAFGRTVLGCRYEELSGCVEVVGIPSSAEHPLPEDEVDVFSLADAEAYP